MSPVSPRGLRIPIAAALAAAASPAALAIDLHAFWDARCYECHGHAGEFARQRLKVVNGRLAGTRHKEDLAGFLVAHEAGRAQAEPIYRMLLAQATTSPVYREKCGGCHANAAELARKDLKLADGRIVGAASGRPMEEFLQRHGKLAPAEIPIVVDSLTRVFREVHGG